MRCAVCGGENPNLKTPSGQEVVCRVACGRDGRCEKVSFTQSHRRLDRRRVAHGALTLQTTSLQMVGKTSKELERKASEKEEEEQEEIPLSVTTEDVIYEFRGVYGAQRAIQRSILTSRCINISSSLVNPNLLHTPTLTQTLTRTNPNP